jgi:hypothetical protein
MPVDAEPAHHEGDLHPAGNMATTTYQIHMWWTGDQDWQADGRRPKVLRTGACTILMAAMSRLDVC